MVPTLCALYLPQHKKFWFVRRKYDPTESITYDTNNAIEWESRDLPFYWLLPLGLLNIWKAYPTKSTSLTDDYYWDFFNKPFTTQLIVVLYLGISSHIFFKQFISEPKPNWTCTKRLMKRLVNEGLHRTFCNFHYNALLSAVS